MESLSGTDEIVEVNEEVESFRHGGRSYSTLGSNPNDRRSPGIPMGRGFVDDEINKLFEAISQRSSARGSASSYQGESSINNLSKHAMKKPIAVGSLQSPRISGEPVSLKAALRDLCISKASEMAAMKRQSKPCGSPGPSEAGRIQILYDLVVDANQSTHSVDKFKAYNGETMCSPESYKGVNYGKKVTPFHNMSRMTNLSKSLDLTLQSTSVFQPFSPTSLSTHSSPKYVNKGSKHGAEVAPVSKSFQAQPSKSLNQITLPSPRFAVPRVYDITPNNASPTLRKSENEHSKPPSPNAQSSTRLGDPGRVRGDNVALQRASTPGTKVGGPMAKAEVSLNETHTPSTSKPADSTGNKIIVSSVSKRMTSKALGQKSGRKNNVQSTGKMKGRSQSGHGLTLHGSRTGKFRKGTRPIKPVLKSVTKKKPKQGVACDASLAGDGKNAHTVITSHAVCQKCHCAIKNSNEDLNEDSPVSLIVSDGVETSTSNDFSDSGNQNTPASNYIAARSVGKTQKNMKSKEKGELSQSSKSSLGEFSTSTSNSEDSSTSRPSCGNKPHMSKDVRWEVIRHVKMRDGFLSLKHFNLLKKLGCGDIGTVYLAELLGSSCLFAIKVMDNEFLARRKKMPRAHTEREILRILDHPFLPTLYTQFTSDNLSCLVMEYCPGGDLHVLRQKQPGRCFPEPAARFYVAEVLLALEYLHMLGIIYRDLKPENILVRDDGHIMLTDFDLSLTCNVNPTLLESSITNSDSRKQSAPCTGSNCIQPFCIKPVCRVPCFGPKILPSSGNARRAKADSATQIKSYPQLVAEPTDARSNSFVGTHEYLAPEIIKGDGHGAAVDWWTFGIFLYELLYGRTPFKGCGNEETLANVVLQSLTFPDTPLVSFQARDLIRRLLVKEPENRLGSEKGAADIKLHPFFEGLNWALIRCTIPPETPDSYDFGAPRMPSHEKNSKLMACKTTGEHLEFELF